MFGRALTALVVVAAALTAASSAQAATTQCKGRVVTGVVAGNLLVPDGWRCELDHADVMGTVNVEDGATLVAFDSRIRGNLVCHRCARMSVNFMFGVGGDVRIRGMTGGVVNFDGVPVGGRFQARNNAAEFSIIDTLAVGRSASRAIPAVPASGSPGPNDYRQVLGQPRRRVRIVRGAGQATGRFGRARGDSRVEIRE